MPAEGASSKKRPRGEEGDGGRSKKKAAPAANTRRQLRAAMSRYARIGQTALAAVQRAQAPRRVPGFVFGASSRRRV